MKKLLILLFLLPFTVCFAQSYTGTFQSITGIQVNKDLPKGFDISGQYQLRLSNSDITIVKGSYFYASLQYSLIKKILTTEFEYRYATSTTKDQHRFGWGLNAKYKYHKVTFSDRIIYQRGHEYFNPAYEDGHEPSNYIRNRFQVKWHFTKHWDAYVSCEPFLKISNKEHKIDRIRAIAGINWEVKKNHVVNIYGMFQPDVNQQEPEMEYTIGCIYEWDIPKFKKKEKN